MTTLFIDIETYSEVNLTRAGAHRYAEHPSTEVLLFGYAIGDGPAHVIDLTAEPDDSRIQVLNDASMTLIAHNSAFDRVVLQHALGIAAPLSRWRCSMAKALSVSLPGALAMLSQVLGLTDDQAKIADGKRLVQKFCKPAPANRKVRR
ncbi:MAG TPA: hypothetical protein VFL97_10790, partial [Nitrococcus sp.]|nr:hypothetical protein [Nitrococcus sp.]